MWLQRGAVFAPCPLIEGNNLPSNLEDLSLLIRDLPVPVVSPKSNEDRKLLRRSRKKATAAANNGKKSWKEGQPHREFTESKTEAQEAI
jgi:hypothetical protein